MILAMVPDNAHDSSASSYPQPCASSATEAKMPYCPERQAVIDRITGHMAGNRRGIAVGRALPLSFGPLSLAQVNERNELDVVITLLQCFWKCCKPLWRKCDVYRKKAPQRACTHFWKFLTIGRKGKPRTALHVRAWLVDEIKIRFKDAAFPSTWISYDVMEKVLNKLLWYCAQPKTVFIHRLYPEQGRHRRPAKESVTVLPSAIVIYVCRAICDV